MREAYYGHESQIMGVEEVRLVGGRGDGMRLFQVRNGRGLEFTVSADRCADISRLSFKGDNYSYFSVGGYTAPAYYDDRGAGWLKSFTCGLFTTCGLDYLGGACVDEGEELGLHGRIGNQPAERIYWDEDEEKIWLRAHISQAQIFGRKLELVRTITVRKDSNVLCIDDAVTNHADCKSPLMLLYHMNMGYPLLSENAELYIPANSVKPRNERAAEDFATWNKVIPPTPGFEEQCYFHDFAGKDGLAAIYNPDIAKGLAIHFDTSTLDRLTQWKMMGYKDYVMGLEPGNCYPDGRPAARADGSLKYIEAGETVHFHIRLEAIDGEKEWEQLKK